MRAVSPLLPVLTLFNSYSDSETCDARRLVDQTAGAFSEKEIPILTTEGIILHEEEDLR